MNKEFERIKSKYFRQVELGNDKGADKIINFHLKAFLQDQYEAVSYAIKDAEALFENNKFTEEIDKLRKKKEFLESLVFDEVEWKKFSQKLKEQGSLNLEPIQNAD